MTVRLPSIPLSARILLALMLAGAGPAANAAMSCPSGIAANHTIRLVPDNLPTVNSAGTVCGPAQTQLANTAAGGIGVVGITAGGVGATAGAGAISAKENTLVHATATSVTNIEFTLVKVDNSLPNFIFQQVGYEVEVLTILAGVGATSPGAATLSGRGTVNIFSINDAGQMIAAGGVPVEHRNGIAVSLGTGDITRFGDPTVTVEVGRLHAAAFGVIAFAQALVGSGSPVGSAAAQLSIAISGIITPPPGYAIEFTGQAPGFGLYQGVAAPLSLVPLPAAVWLFAAGLLVLPRCTSRR